jgi:predicted RNase H-like HicB family nuclease
MKLKIIVHEAQEGGFWGEVPAIPGCASQGETVEALLKNLREAIEGCLSVDVPETGKLDHDQVLEIAI